MANNRVLSHQLSNGLYVSGAPDQYKERPVTMTSTAMPYTGGDIKKSGELGKMFDISVEAPKLKKSGPIHGGAARAGSFRGPSSNSGPLSGNIIPPQSSTGSRQSSNSGPLSKSGDPVIVNIHQNQKSLKTSGPLSRQNSGPLTPNLPATGLITSGPISSGPLSASGGASRKYSGPIDGGMPMRHANNHAVSKLSADQSYSFSRNFPRIILWTVVPLFIIGFVAGGFILGAVQNAVLLIVVASLFGMVLMLLVWNTCVGQGAVTGFVSSYPDIGLNQAKDGQYVKITGIVTCGSIPLESSYQRVNRCVYTSSGLYEYRNFKAKPAQPKHHTFTWGLRHLERHVVDFYISDYQSGLRALVKAGYGATVSAYVEESTVLDVGARNEDLPPNFVRWLADRNLSSDDRVMRLKEGYIKEGSTVTVMGVVQRTDNVLMIVPPSEPVSTGCQWTRFLLPANLEGIVLISEDNCKADVIPV
ncbi:hypothetical protein KP509_12G073600 [Ceratopteris richardii]|uniref:Ubiquitin-specific protease family C19-related protein n=1 Tax=Ceratopteris richardii TaxID=49495 RepID=A0A8T2TQT8_CERRI|nr:hypothetical protein KP509_12G073600 [Ceratopteris richardii]